MERDDPQNPSAVDLAGRAVLEAYQTARERLDPDERDVLAQRLRDYFAEEADGE